MATVAFASTQGIVNTTTAGLQGQPSIATLANGDFVVGWEGYDPGTNSRDVFAQRYDAAWRPISSEIIVNRTMTKNFQHDISLTGLDSGGFVATWVGNGKETNEIFAQRFTSDGAPTGDPIYVSSTIIAGISPVAAALKGGDTAIFSSSGARRTHGRAISMSWPNAFARTGSRSANRFGPARPRPTTQSRPRSQRCATVATSSPGRDTTRRPGTRR